MGNAPVGVGRVVSPVLVGRDAELRRLITAVAQSPSVAVVEGEAGIGKSRLVAELAERQAVNGRQVLTGSCDRLREPFPLGPLVEALRSSATHLAGAVLSPVAGALRGLLPELSDVLPAAPEALGDRAVERHRLFRGLVEVVGALGPLVLVIEDLHWADAQTVEFLTYLLSNPPGDLSLVLTYRAEETEAQVRAVTARPADSVTREHIVLKPLDAERTRELAAVILELDDVSTAFATHLCERASGLPLAVQELLALLRARGGIIRWEGGWARRTLDSLDVPTSVRDSVQERVGGLPDAARAVAEAAAVLQHMLPIDTLADVSGLPRPEALDAVDEVLVSGLFAERDGLVGFRHVLASQAVFDGLPPARRRLLHTRAAAAVQHLAPVPLGHLAHHLRHAGRPQEWVVAAERAAAQATALGDDAEAVRLLEDVLRHAALEPDRRAQLTAALSRAAVRVLRMPDISDLFLRALEARPSPPARGRLHFELGSYLGVTGADPARVRRELAKAVETLLDEPELTATAMLNLGLPTGAGIGLPEHIAWLERALDMLPEVADQDFQVFALGRAAQVFAAVGDSRWSALAARFRTVTAEQPRSRRAVNSFYAVGLQATNSGHHTAGRQLLRAAVAGAAGSDAVGEDMELRCRAGIVLADYCDGSWAGLDTEIALLEDALRDRVNDRLFVAMARACLLLQSGDLDGSAALLREVLRRAQETDAVDCLAIPATALIRLTVARGDATSALEESAGRVAAWESKGLWPIGVRAVPALVEALLAAGRATDAAVLVRGYEERLRGLDAPLAGPCLRHARGLLAAAQERWAQAVEHFTGAANGFRQLPAVYETAQAEEQLAVCLLASGKSGPAEDVLYRAISTYGTLGAGWDRDRATRLARRAGLRPAPAQRPQRPRAGRDPDAVLTNRQQEVARMAAAGLTNREIARELFLSPRTVDKHLSVALRKFGVRSRVELSGKLADPTGG
ncbi:AAA family ATPase [Streptomyces sp. NPDC050738]|uniref:ATP-binding protein n=1 Tax=Streptomyces sp. NPDC050738 TaxID=3154744 RepID=UPI003435583B